MPDVSPFAHMGHWAANLLYLAPVVLVAGVLALQGRRARRQPERDAGH